ncbi:hypothetical protein QR680_003026 [Steinernema hermaphroditum]|uniref:Uncharacterized protein n=1 Tax=Steinernema hermaphroditum TaxID=289476 RepID=A0AA39H536_9BILA|nr:hypothetical protein QR680_003026 [Steinernema hermaphroditum]
MEAAKSKTKNRPKAKMPKDDVGKPNGKDEKSHRVGDTGDIQTGASETDRARDTFQDSGEIGKALKDDMDMVGNNEHLVTQSPLLKSMTGSSAGLPHMEDEATKYLQDHAKTIANSGATADDVSGDIKSESEGSKAASVSEGLEVNGLSTPATVDDAKDIVPINGAESQEVTVQAQKASEEADSHNQNLTKDTELKAPPPDGITDVKALSEALKVASEVAAQNQEDEEVALLMPSTDPLSQNPPPKSGKKKKSGKKSPRSNASTTKPQQTTSADGPLPTAISEAIQRLFDDKDDDKLSPESRRRKEVARAISSQDFWDYIPNMDDSNHVPGAEVLDNGLTQYFADRNLLEKVSGEPVQKPTSKEKDIPTDQTQNSQTDCKVSITQSSKSQLPVASKSQLPVARAPRKQWSRKNNALACRRVTMDRITEERAKKDLVIDTTEAPVRDPSRECWYKMYKELCAERQKFWNHFAKRLYEVESEHEAHEDARFSSLFPYRPEELKPAADGKSDLLLKLRTDFTIRSFHARLQVREHFKSQFLDSVLDEGHPEEEVLKYSVKQCTLPDRALVFVVDGRQRRFLERMKTVKHNFLHVREELEKKADEVVNAMRAEIAKKYNIQTEVAEGERSMEPFEPTPREKELFLSADSPWKLSLLHGPQTDESRDLNSYLKLWRLPAAHPMDPRSTMQYIQMCRQQKWPFQFPYANQLLKPNPPACETVVQSEPQAENVPHDPSFEGDANIDSSLIKRLYHEFAHDELDISVLALRRLVDYLHVEPEEKQWFADYIHELLDTRLKQPESKAKLRRLLPYATDIHYPFAQLFLAVLEGDVDALEKKEQQREARIRRWKERIAHKWKCFKASIILSVSYSHIVSAAFKRSLFPVFSKYPLIFVIV